MTPANLDKNGQMEQTEDEGKRANKYNKKWLKECTRKLPVIIDRLAITIFIVLEITFYCVFIPV